ncbi:MAG TPA: hypothetical protein VF384_20215 [Planctomycetota bacterium]
MKRHRTSLLSLLCLAACTTVDHDPFESAELALRQHDLVGALLAYDAVPVTHARYPEAHAAAASIEGRIRRCHEMLLEALTLRAEWRDADALGFLRLAQAVWPSLPGVEGLIAATEQRIRLFESGSARPETPAESAAAPGVELAPTTASMLPGSSSATPGLAAGDSLPESEAVETADNTGASTGPPASQDAVSRGLAQVESCLASGDLQAAVADLFELARRFPSDARVQARLARLLHQRALLLYGQGAVSGAIADWEQLLEIYPSHHLAADLLRAARAETNPSAPRRTLPSRVRNGLR